MKFMKKSKSQFYVLKYIILAMKNILIFEIKKREYYERKIQQ